MPKVKRVFRSKVNKENLSKHEYFDFKNMSITQIVGVFLVSILLIGILTTTIVISIKNNGSIGVPTYTSSDYSTSFDDGWTTIFNNTGEVKENTNLKTYNIKAEYKSNEGITFYKKIPTDVSTGYSVGFVVKNAVFNAYVDYDDNGVIEDNEFVGTTHYYHGENHYIGTYWDYVLLNDSMEGHNLYIKFTSKSTMSGFVSNFFYGNTASTYYQFYRTIVFQFFLSFALLFFCIILLLVSYINQISRKQAPQLSIISLFGIFFSLYILFESGYLQVLTGNTYIFKTMSYLSLCISGWMMSFYLYLKSQSMRFIQFARILIWYFILTIGAIMVTTLVPEFELSLTSPIMISGFYAVCVSSTFNALEEMKRDKINTIFFVQMIVFFVGVTVSGIFQAFDLVRVSNIIMLSGIIFVTVCALTFEYQFNVLKSTKVMQKQKEEQDTKVAIMLAQIQPHFLYNSLNSIAILCEVNPKQAHDLTIKFAQYLRNNIDALSKDTPILFRTELRSIKNYLDIERIRFSDKLNIVDNIQVSDFYVPVLTIQPLVENAVKHGISKKPTPGVLMLSTTEDTNNFYVIIEDSGVGFDTSILEIKEKLGKSIGISNVKYRLKSMVGGDVKIESTIGKGTKVTVTLPKVLNKTGQVEE